MYNPYQIYNNHYNTQSNILPPQQIIQVNGKSSVDTIQLAPNSSILVMDTSAPIVWMCVSDGIGKVTATPYDIVVHKEEPAIDVGNLEQRVAAIELTVAQIGEKINAKSNASRAKSKSALADDISD